MAEHRPLIICRPDRVGDVIIATSCLEPIRRQRPGQPLIFMAREVMRPLLEGHPLLDGFVGLSDWGTKPANRRVRLRPLTDQLRPWRAETLVHLHPDPACQWSAKEVGIPRRIGYRHGFFLDRTLTERFPDRRREGRKHEAEYNFDLLAPLGIRPPVQGEPPLRPSVHLPEPWRKSLRLRLTAAGWEDFDKDTARYAVLNPTAFSPDLRWPAEYFAWLARELLNGGHFEKVVLVADRHDDPSVRQIHRLLGAGVPGFLDLSGTTNLAELGWLLRFARVLVSRNTGTTHLAAAVGCPTVELFGRLEPIYGPERWRSLGDAVEIVTPAPNRRRWGESRRAFWRRNYHSISRESVLAATLKLGRTQPKPRPDAH